MASELKASMRIVVLRGPERFLVEEYTRRLVEILKREFGDVERFDLQGETAKTSTVLDELRTFGLFGPHKLVVLEDADVFLKGGRGADEDGEEESPEESPGGAKVAPARRRAMEAYAERPNAQSTLLMRAATWRPGKVDALIEKAGMFIKCEPVKDAAAWCCRECEPRHKARISREAAQLLVERVGNDLLRLDAELEKLAVHAGSGSISRGDVEVLVGGGLEEKAWVLQSALLSGSPKAALRKIDQVLELEKNDWILLGWAVTDLLRRLHLMAQLLRQGVRLESRRGELRLFGPEGDRMIALAQSGPARFAQLLRQAIESDHRTKSGRGDPRRNLEVLTLHVTDSFARV